MAATLQAVIAGGSGEHVGLATAMLIRLLREAGLRPVLAIDAHPGAGLAARLGVESGAPAADVMEQVLQVEEKAKELLLEQRVQQECIAEGRGFDLLTMGRPAGLDAHCYLNAVFCETLANLKGNYPAVVTACERELQHICRLNRGDIDCLLILSDPAPADLEDAALTLKRAEESGMRIRRRLLAWNGDPDRGLPAALAEVAQAFGVQGIIGLPLTELIGLKPAKNAVMEAPLPTPCANLLSLLLGKEA